MLSDLVCPTRLQYDGGGGFAATVTKYVHMGERFSSIEGRVPGASCRQASGEYSQITPVDRVVAKGIGDTFIDLPAQAKQEEARGGLIQTMMKPHVVEISAQS